MRALFRPIVRAGLCGLTLWAASVLPALAAPADQAATPTVVGAAVVVTQPNATPTVRVIAVTTSQQPTTAPRTGGLPTELAVPLVVGGLSALAAGGGLLRRRR